MAGPEAFGSRPYAANRTVSAEVVTVLRGTTKSRGLKLEAYRSRAVVAGDVHELMVTDQREAEPNTTVDSVGLIAFVAVESSGVLLVGSTVMVGGRSLGEVVGFDDTHMPNHQNICVYVDELTDGLGMGVELGTAVQFVMRATGLK